MCTSTDGANGTDCWAHEDWGEPQTCANDYIPTSVDGYSQYTCCSAYLSSSRYNCVKPTDPAEVYAQVRDIVGTACGSNCVGLAEQAVEKGEACLSSMGTVNISGVELPTGSCTDACMELVDLVNSTECELLAEITIPADVYGAIEEVCHIAQVCADESVQLQELVMECAEGLGGAITSLNASELCSPACMTALDIATNSSCEAAVQGTPLAEPPQVQFYGGDYESHDCWMGEPVEWHLEPYPSSAESADYSCSVPPNSDGSWALKGEYCDFSVEPPMLRGNYFMSDDCSTEAIPYSLVADGSCVNHNADATCDESLCTSTDGANGTD